MCLHMTNHPDSVGSLTRLPLYSLSFFVLFPETEDNGQILREKERKREREDQLLTDKLTRQGKERRMGWLAKKQQQKKEKVTWEGGLERKRDGGNK